MLMKVNKLIYMGTNNDIDECTALAVTSDNRHIVSCSEDKSIKVFDLQTKEQVYHFQNAHESKGISVDLHKL